jgi:Protein phosphatase 2C
LPSSALQHGKAPVGEAGRRATPPVGWLGQQAQDRETLLSRLLYHSFARKAGQFGIIFWVGLSCIHALVEWAYLSGKQARGSLVGFAAKAIPLSRCCGLIFSPSKANDTVVRIPLRSAKQHFGVTRARGNRAYNEDWYQAGVISLPPFAPLATSSPPDSPVFYFGVFDGHGGEDCSSFLRNHLHAYIEETAKSFGGGDEQKAAMQTQLVAAWKDTVGGYFRRFKPDFSGQGEAGELESILTYAFLKADMDFITRTKPWFLTSESGGPEEQTQKTKSTPFKGGSTASVALISTPWVPFPFSPHHDPSNHCIAVLQLPSGTPEPLQQSSALISATHASFFHQLQMGSHCP